MPSDEFPNGTVLSRENMYSGRRRRLRVLSGSEKKIRVQYLDGPLKDDEVTLSIPQARACEVVVS
jgi:hypothetical protein